MDRHKRGSMALAPTRALSPVPSQAAGESTSAKHAPSPSRSGRREATTHEVFSGRTANRHRNAAILRVKALYIKKSRSECQARAVGMVAALFTVFSSIPILAVEDAIVRLITVCVILCVAAIFVATSSAMAAHATEYGTLAKFGELLIAGGHMEAIWILPSPDRGVSFADASTGQVQRPMSSRRSERRRGR